MIDHLSTRTRSERLEFLQRRQKGIGGSDMPVILGLSTYVPKGRSLPLNCLDVYYSKTRPIRESDIEDETIHQLRGHSFEGMALEHYRLQTGRGVRKKAGPTRHPDYPNVVVSLDFDIFADDDRDEGFRGTGVGETKSPVSSVFGNVIDHGLRQSEIVQIQTNIAVARRTWGSFCYFNMEHNSGPVIAVDQGADLAMGKFLLENGQRFWDEHVVPKIPPVPSEWKLLEDENAPTIVDMSGKLEVIDGDEVFRHLVGRLLDRKDLAKEGKEDFDETKQQVLDYLLERKIGKAQLPELARLTVVTKKGRTSRNWSQLTDALPLDRDKVERWLNHHKDAEIPPADVGRMLFECVIDLSLFESVGDTIQYLLPNRSAK